MKLSVHSLWDRLGADFFQRPAEQRRIELPVIRQEVLATLGDCHCDRSQRLVHRIIRARTPDELWVLRNDIHQCISQTYTQSEASARMNTLAPLFKGWVSESRLVPI